MQATHNASIDEIHEEMDQMRIELGFVLIHVIGGAEQVNSVNYLTRPPSSADDYYYEEDTYAVNVQTGGF